MKPDETPTVVEASNMPQRRRIGILICLAVSAGTGLAWSLEQRMPSFSGILEAKKTVVTTNCTARVKEVSVKTGQSVIPGQALCQLIDASLEDRLIGKRREIAEYEAEITRSKAAADVELAWRRRELQTEIFETQLKLAGLVQEKLNKQVEQIAWKERLSVTDSLVIPTGAEVDNPFRSISIDLSRPDDRRFMAMLREDAAAASAEALTTQIALCEQRLKNLEVLEKNLEVKIRASSGVDVAEARLNGSKQEMAAVESQAKELAMVSSTHGTIGEINFQTGDRVPSGGILIEILDDQQQHVIARIPSHTASRFHQGAKVTLIFPQSEYRTGIVASLPPQTISVAGQSESYLPVKIEPAGKLWPKLAIGSNVKVQLQ